MTNPGFQPAPTNDSPPSDLKGAAKAAWLRRVAEVVNVLLRGKMNAVLPITLTANSGTTIIQDARIGYYSYLGLQPLTAHAAAALYGTPYVLPSAQATGTVTLNHVNDANTDKNFNLLIIG